MKLNCNRVKVEPVIKFGSYTDEYFNNTKRILEWDHHRPIVRIQIFQKNNNACLCGIDESIHIMKQILNTSFEKLTIRSLRDGDIINAWETVMLIEGDYSLFAHLETVYLGTLARGTKVATNVYRCVKAAKGKPILFFPARFDSYTVQPKDGYSYSVGREAAGLPLCGGVSTDAQGWWWGEKGIGTMPHGLIAAYGGDTVTATLKFCQFIDPMVKRVVLVDFDNDSVKTSLDVANAMWLKYQETRDPRYKLFGVRLDTSGTMVDKSVLDSIDDEGTFVPHNLHEITGVNPQLVKNVFLALRNRSLDFKVGSVGRQFFSDIKIVVSGGFTPEKISKFERLDLPVYAYGVGSSMFDGKFDFTADIVQRSLGMWINCAKKGRKYNFNTIRLKRVI